MADYKVVDAEQLNADLAEIAEYIRTKGETKEDLLFPDGFISAVDNITAVTNGTKPGTITSNGNHPTDSYSNVEVDVKFTTQEKTVTPSKSSQIVTPDSDNDGLSQVTVNAIPSSYIDTSGATAGAYDIYYNKTAYINNVLITGAYRVEGRTGSQQINSGSTNCSSSKLVLPCPFEPTHICVILNAGTYNTNTIIAAFFQPGGVATYHSRTSSGVTRNQYTSSISNYVTYDSTNKQVIVNRPTTSYSWSSQNYRYFCFK